MHAIGEIIIYGALAIASVLLFALLICMREDRP